MSAPPKPFSLNREDFGSEPYWDKLFRPLNTFAAQVSSALGGLTRRDNMASQVEEVVFTTTASSGLPGDALYFGHKFRGRPTMLWVAFAENLTTPTSTFSTSIFPTWDVVNDSAGTRIKIRALTGLSANTKYRIRFVVE